MKILHVVRALNIGGLERVVLNLAEACRAQGDKVLIACMYEKGQWGENKPDIVVLPGHSRIAKARALAALARRENVDILHSHNPEPHVTATLSQIFRTTKVVHTKHGRNYPKNWRRVLINRWMYHLGDATVAVSQDATNVARDIEHCPPNKLHLIHNAIDTTRFLPMPSTVRQAFRDAHGIPDNTFVVGSVGRLSPEKNYRGLVDAFASLLQDIPNARLILIGDGSEAHPLQQQAKQLGMEHACMFLGAQTDVQAWMGAMDVFALNSFTEGLSMTLLEACACGVPSVATDVGGNREIVRTNQTGILIPGENLHALSDAMRNLYINPSLRRQMGKAAHDLVARSYSLDHMIHAYRKLYAELIQ